MARMVHSLLLTMLPAFCLNLTTFSPEHGPHLPRPTDHTGRHTCTAASSKTLLAHFVISQFHHTWRRPGVPLFLSSFNRSECCGVVLRLTMVGTDPLPPELRPMMQTMWPRVQHHPSTIELNDVLVRLERLSNRSYESVRERAAQMQAKRRGFLWTGIKPLILLLFEELIHPHATHIGYLDTDAVYGTGLSRGIRALEQHGFHGGPAGKGTNGRHHVAGSLQYYRKVEWDKTLAPTIRKFVRDPRWPLIHHGWDEWWGMPPGGSFATTLSGLVDALVHRGQWRACPQRFCPFATPRETVGCHAGFTRNRELARAGYDLAYSGCTACQMTLDAAGRSRLVQHGPHEIRHEGAQCHFIDIGKFVGDLLRCNSTECLDTAIRLTSESCVEIGVHKEVRKGENVKQDLAEMATSTGLIWSSNFNHSHDAGPWTARWSMCTPSISDANLIKLDTSEVECY